MIHGKNVNELIDPNLEGNFSAEEATVVFKLASQCLEYNDRESLNTNDLVAVLEPLQTITEVRKGLIVTVIAFLIFVCFHIHVKTDLLSCRSHLMEWLK